MSDISKNLTVTVNYASPGARPPVYIAGSFSSPPWQPQELDFVEDESGNSLEKKEYKFFAHLQLEEGQWEYKFRLGNGNWWVCDDSTETGETTFVIIMGRMKTKSWLVFDKSGNENNLLVVRSSNSRSPLDSRPVKTTPEDGSIAVTELSEILKGVDEISPSDPNQNHSNQFLGHEAESESFQRGNHSVNFTIREDVPRAFAENFILYSEATEKDDAVFRPSDPSSMPLVASQKAGRPQNANDIFIPREREDFQPLLEHDTMQEDGIRQRKTTVDVAPIPSRKMTDNSHVSENWFRYLWQCFLLWFFSICHNIFGTNSG